MQNSPIELHQWVNYYRQLHLTKSDIERLGRGNSIEVVAFDRNMEENCRIYEDFTENESYSPEQMFANCRCMLSLISTNPYKWDLQYLDNTYEHFVDMDVSSMETGWLWYPLNDDNEIKLETTIQNWYITELSEPIVKHWEEFDDETRVGWSGPMIRWNDIADLRQVYWN